MALVSGRFGIWTAAVVAALSTLLGGCVGQGEHDNLMETNRSLTSRNAELQRERDEAMRALELARQSGVGSERTLSELQARNADLQRQLDGALSSLRDLEGRMAGLDFGRLDPDTDEALKRLAAEFPDLIRYDPERGMLRFASDLTFDSGSAVVRPEARSALNALSRVLQQASARQYEVVVEGHTDAQRISAATAQRHPTNRHLSAHRAIAVIDELGRLGVPSQRMLATGWGEFRPAVPNNMPTGNTPQNRRVEIYLAKPKAASSLDFPVGAASPARPRTAAPDQTPPPARPRDFSK